MDAVVALLESGAFTADEPGASEAAGPPEVARPAEAAGQAEAAGPAGGAGQAAALHFLAAHLASNRAAVSGRVLLRVLDHLAAPSRPAAAGMAGSMSPAQREAVFCDVVSAAGAGMSVPDQQQVG